MTAIAISIQYDPFAEVYIQQNGFIWVEQPRIQIDSNFAAILTVQEPFSNPNISDLSWLPEAIDTDPRPGSASYLFYRTYFAILRRGYVGVFTVVHYRYSTEGNLIGGPWEYTYSVKINKGAAIYCKYNTPLTIPVIHPDVQGIVSLTSVTKPSYGTAAVSGGNIVYTPPSGFYSPPEVPIYFVVTNDIGQAVECLAYVTVGQSYDITPPNAPDFSVTIPSDNVGQLITVKGPGIVPNGSAEIDHSLLSHPANGAILDKNIAGVDRRYCIIYRPNVGYEGTDSIVYTINDPTKNDGYRTDTGTITITVGSPDIFTLTDDAVTTAYGSSAIIDVLDNDVGRSVSIIGMTQPLNGVAVVENGKIKYTPNSGFFGIDAFNYFASNGTATSQATITVTVSPPGVVNAPVITNSPTGTIEVQQRFEYSLTMTATGGVPPYKWSIRGQTGAANWLAIDANTGALSGTFFNGLAMFGDVDTFHVTVTDSAVTPGSDTTTISFVLVAPPYTATIQGTLRLDTTTGDFAARKVYLYNYTTGDKVTETTSDGTTGEWEFTQVAPGEYFVVGAAQGDDLNVPRDFDAMGVITVV